MKNILFISIITLLFIGCGSSGGGDFTLPADNNRTKSGDIVLKKGDSIVCTQETSFSIEPTDNPLVSFSKNIGNGEVTIVLDIKSGGFVTVVGCTEK